MRVNEKAAVNLNTLWNAIEQNIINFKEEKNKKDDKIRFEHIKKDAKLFIEVISSNPNDVSREFLIEIREKLEPSIKLFNSKPKHKNNREGVCLHEVGMFLKDFSKQVKQIIS